MVKQIRKANFFDRETKNKILKYLEGSTIDFIAFKPITKKLQRQIEEEKGKRKWGLMVIKTSADSLKLSNIAYDCSEIRLVVQY